MYDSRKRLQLVCRNLNRELGMPVNLQQMAVVPLDFERMAAGALRDACCKSPSPLSYPLRYCSDSETESALASARQCW